MSNSSLVSYTKWSPHKRSRGGNKISKITIHHCATVNASLQAIGNAFSGKTVASSHYCIDSNGNVAQYVDEVDRAITSSSTANDNVAVTIEVMNSTGAPKWEVSDKAYAKLIELCVDICKRNGIKELNYTGTSAGNLTRHDMFANTTCPGPYLGPKFPAIAAAVNKQLGVVSTPAQPANQNLYYGSKGEAVKDLQTDLNQLGYNLAVDGDFGSKTQAAVKDFQKKNKLTVDGIVGPLTEAAIDKALAAKRTYMVKVTASILNIRSGPSSVKYKVVGQIRDKGIYTIVETQGSWGKLKSGAGWIYLPYTKKI